MKNIQSVKQNITRINKSCDTLGISIFEYLTLKRISFFDFCSLIGLEKELLTDIPLNELLYILKDNSTRIVYSSGMTSLEHDEIEIYSPNLKTSICYLENKIKIIWDSLNSKDGLDFYTSEFMEVRKIDNVIETIHFSSDLTIDPTKANERIISLKYPLEHASIKIKYKKLVNGSLNEEKSFQITINHDLLHSDLKNIQRILYNFNYSLAIAILKLYPSSFKIMSDEVEMNNFHNR